MDTNRIGISSVNDTWTFFLYSGGMVGRKIYFPLCCKVLFSLGVVSLIWIVVGFSLSFGSSIGFEINGIKYGIIGNPFEYFFFDGVSTFTHKSLASTIPFLLFALFQMKFAVITPALITGSFAERVRFISYLLFIVLFSLFIYTPLCHMIWYPDGLLNKYFGVKTLRAALLSIWVQASLPLQVQWF